MDAASRSKTLLVCALLVLAVGLAGCTQSGPAPPPGDGNGSGDPDPPDEEEENGIDWNSLPGPQEVPTADEPRLMELVHQQVYENETTEEPRYRTPGTSGHEAAIPELVGMLEEAGAEVERQTFEVELPDLGKVNATNVYGTRPGNESGEIWLAAHWDSRAWADQAADEDRREEPVLGANDGAAAVAVVTHALEILPATNATIRVALFDVEDQGRGGQGWIQGSSHAAERLTDDELDRIQAFLLVDMPGHDPLSIKREGLSNDRAPLLTDVTFGVAERLKAPSFTNETGPAITDDHVPFLQRNVSAVDLIHLDDNGTSPFPWTWHTPHDTVEPLSATSMAEVTRVVAGTVIAVDQGALPTEDHPSSGSA